jgi:DNA-directed RNA polymerase subunit beta
MALGLDAEEILDTFYTQVESTRQTGRLADAVRARAPEGQKATYDLIDADSGEVVVEVAGKITPRTIKQLAEKGVKRSK